MRTVCEYCGRVILLTNWDADGVFVGAECKCGEYVTRYTDEFLADSDIDSDYLYG